jgi:hypothetical protein
MAEMFVSSHNPHTHKPIKISTLAQKSSENVRDFSLTFTDPHSLFDRKMPIMYKMTKIAKQIPFLVIFPLLILGLSCGDDPLTPDDTDGYVVSGVLFFNCNDMSSLCYLRLTEDGTNFADAQVTVGGSPITYAGQGVYRASSPGLNLVPGAESTVTIRSASGDLLFSRSFVIPDTFSVVVAYPANRLYVTGGNVLVEWTASVGSQHYAGTVVPKDSGAVIPDYAKPATEVKNAWTITPDAFQKSDGTLVQDRYDIYILAYGETFYSTAGISEIFFPLPSGLFTTGNIDTETFSGTIGVGTLSKGDYVDVEKQE